MQILQLLAIILALSVSEASFLKVPIVKRRFNEDGVVSNLQKPHFIVKNENKLVKRNHPNADLEMSVKFNQLMYEAEIEIGSNRDIVKLLVDTGSSDMFVNEYNTEGCAHYRTQGESGGSDVDEGNNAIYESSDEPNQCGMDHIKPKPEPTTATLTESGAPNKSSLINSRSTSYPRIDKIISPYSSNDQYMQKISNTIPDPNLCDNYGFFNYQNSTSLINSSLPLNIKYGDGLEAVGSFVQDTVFLNGVKIPNTMFGINFEGYRPSGVLGIGFKANQSPFQHGEQTYSSFPYHLKELGITQRVAYSFYAPYDSSSNTAITFGAYDKDGYLPSSGLTLLPITDFTPSSKAGSGPYHLSITLNSVSFTTPETSNELIATGNAAVILDTGFTSSSIPYYILNEILAKFKFQYSTQLSNYVISASDIPKNDAFISFNFQNAIIKMPIIDFTLPVIDVETLSDTGLRALSMKAAEQDYFILGDDFLSNIFFVADLEAKQIAVGQVNPESPGTSMVVIENGIHDAVESTNWDQVYGKDGVTKLSLRSVDDPDELPNYDKDLSNKDIYYLGAGQPLGW
jgi:yapsin 1